jgi:hypothetical protein
MAAMTRLTFVLVVLAAACGKKAPDGKTPDDTGDTTPDPPDTCAVAGATPLAVWTPPAGCELRDIGAATWIKTADDVAAHLACTGTAPAVTTPVVAISRQLSPATVGFDAYDDGKTITWVGKQRNPCPGEPPPMPITRTYAFTVPAGGDRAYAESTCTVAVKCR